MIEIAVNTKGAKHVEAVEPKDEVLFVRVSATVRKWVARQAKAHGNMAENHFVDALIRKIIAEDRQARKRRLA